MVCRSAGHTPRVVCRCAAPTPRCRRAGARACTYIAGLMSRGQRVAANVAHDTDDLERRRSNSCHRSWSDRSPMCLPIASPAGNSVSANSCVTMRTGAAFSSSSAAVKLRPRTERNAHGRESTGSPRCSAPPTAPATAAARAGARRCGCPRASRHRRAERDAVGAGSASSARDSRGSSARHRRPWGSAPADRSAPSPARRDESRDRLLQRGEAAQRQPGAEGSISATAISATTARCGCAAMRGSALRDAS